MMYKDLRVGTSVSPSAAAAATVPELTVYVLTVRRRRRAFYLYYNIYIYYYNVCQTMLLYVHKYSERIPHSFKYVYVCTFIYICFRYTSDTRRVQSGGTVTKK